MILQFNTLKIDDDNKLCTIDDEPVKLTKTEYLILFLLMSNQDKVFSREEIMKIVWKKEVKERNVDTHVRRLRNKLLKYKQNLVTRLGFGYGFQTTNLK